MQSNLELVQDEINKVIKGKQDVVKKILTAMIAGGHILLEDIPGVGKTTLAVTTAKTLSLKYSRVQFTPDVLPSDIVGFSMFNSATKEFEYKPGAVMCNLFLADEINRTSPKTQSALLEAMEEGQVTVDGVTRELPQPFTVIATENPQGSAGTQLLPESQLDRFMCSLSLGYPAHDDAIEILRDNHTEPVQHVKAVMNAEELKAYQNKASEMFVHDSMYDYITTIVEKTRGNEKFANGASPRAGIAILRMAKANAVIEGRDFLVPEDIHAVVYDVLRHRLRLSAKAKSENTEFNDAINEILRGIGVPRT